MNELARAKALNDNLNSVRNSLDDVVPEKIIPQMLKDERVVALLKRELEGQKALIEAALALLG